MTEIQADGMMPIESTVRQAAAAACRFQRETDMRARYKIAEKVIEVCSLYPLVQEYCAEYRTEEDADFAVMVTPEELVYEQRIADREQELEGLEPMRFQPEELEIRAVCRLICEKMVDFDTILYHSSAVAVDGEAYLFTAISGTGKSTHARLWRELLGEKAVMINDDKPLLRVREGEVTVFGTPWNGKHRLGCDIAVPLRGLCLLERSETNHIERIRPMAFYPRLMQQAYRPVNPAGTARVLTLLDTLFAAVPVYRLGCNMELDAAKLSYETMKGAQT